MRGDHGCRSPRSARVAVSIGFAAYAPAATDVLAGDTVPGRTTASAAHRAARDGSWDSARMIQGDRYEQRFDAAGAYALLLHAASRAWAARSTSTTCCSPGRRTPAGAGRPYPLSGRAPPHRAPGDDRGRHRRAVSPGRRRARWAPTATFGATVTPPTTATYRAVVPDAEPSPPVQLIVLDHTVTVSVRRRGPVSVVAAQV